MVLSWSSKQQPFVSSTLFVNYEWVFWLRLDFESQSPPSYSEGRSVTVFRRWLLVLGPWDIWSLSSEGNPFEQVPLLSFLLPHRVIPLSVCIPHFWHPRAFVQVYSMPSLQNCELDQPLSFLTRLFQVFCSSSRKLTDPLPPISLWVPSVICS